MTDVVSKCTASLNSASDYFESLVFLLRGENDSKQSDEIQAKFFPVLNRFRGLREFAIRVCLRSELSQLFYFRECRAI